MATEAQRKANKVYRAKTRYPFTLDLNKETQADIIEWLNQQPNKRKYITDLIRADMEAHLKRISDEAPANP